MGWVGLWRVGVWCGMWVSGALVWCSLLRFQVHATATGNWDPPFIGGTCVSVAGQHAPYTPTPCS